MVFSQVCCQLVSFRKLIGTVSDWAFQIFVFTTLFFVIEELIEGELFGATPFLIGTFFHNATENGIQRRCRVKGILRTQEALHVTVMTFVAKYMSRGTLQLSKQIYMINEKEV